jgi:hypothetical protein
MSAYVCDEDHIKTLAMFAASRGRHGQSGNVPEYWLRHFGGKDMSGHTPAEVATYFAQVLLDENIRSVAYRYQDSDLDNLPGPVPTPREITVTDSDMHKAREINPLQLLKMCACLNYQSCESEDWRQTVAYTLLGGIKDAAINKLPGYDESPGW